ncbi:MAG: hypothetical protein R3C54_02090 [Parvularculaceae bacterium]|nr:hypothetical protein [Parvularculaceae bacterium]
MAPRGKGRPERLAVLVIAAMAAGCAEKPVGEAKYQANDCRRVALVDSTSGEAIRGAEDLTVDLENQRLFVSAYDRRLVERAARRGEPVIPEGGVYQVSLGAFSSGADEADAWPVAPAGEFTGGLHPHGISYNAEAGEIAFINRAYVRVKGAWKMVPQIERVGVNGEAIVSGAGKTPCAANNVLDEGGAALITFDHERCDWRGGLEDALSLRRSGVADDKGDRLFDRALFANGIARAGDGRIALAATRENALLLMKQEGDKLKLTQRVRLPGGPDNLTVSSDGGIVAAVHPSLMAIGLNRRLGVGKAASRIVKIDPETGAVEILFNDPHGELFSAATVAAEWNGGLILGSVTDEGLLFCKGAE